MFVFLTLFFRQRVEELNADMRWTVSELKYPVVIQGTLRDWLHQCQFFLTRKEANQSGLNTSRDISATVCGRFKYRKHAVVVVKCFPVWKLYNISVIYEAKMETER